MSRLIYLEPTNNLHNIVPNLDIAVLIQTVSQYAIFYVGLFGIFNFELNLFV